MKFLRRIYSTCISLQAYDEFITEPKRRALGYFFVVLILFSVVIYPKYFQKQEEIVIPVLTSLAEKFPKLEFLNNSLVTSFKETLIISNPALSIVISPQVGLGNDILGPVLVFDKTSMRISFNEEEKIFAYDHPMISILFSGLANFRNGSGVLDGQFFLRLAEAFKKTFFLSGLVFLAEFIVVAFFFNIFLAIMGYLYSKMIITSLEWSQIRILSYYAITPVLVLLTLSYYFYKEGVDTLQPVYVLAYMLFLLGAIHRFKKPVEEDNDDLM